MEGRHLAGSYRTASMNYPCKAPGSLLLDSSHRARKVRRVPQTQEGIHPWTGETHFRVTPAACGNSVFRTTARILVPVSDLNPMAIADSGASHVILPQSALLDSKSAKLVNLRLAAGEIMQLKHKGQSLLNTSPFHYAHWDESFGNYSLLRSGHLRL